MSLYKYAKSTNEIYAFVHKANSASAVSLDLFSWLSYWSKFLLNGIEHSTMKICRQWGLLDFNPHKIILFEINKRS